MKKYKTIFAGTAEFAVPILQKLLELDFIDLEYVVTQPDRPSGRGLDLSHSPVKEFVLGFENNLKILQPEKFRELNDWITKEYSPELIIVAAYGQIIPSVVVNSPDSGCINFHGSILPALRGAVPVHMAILKGLAETGVTMQKMVEKMDAGPIIATKTTDIPSSFTTKDLMKRLANLASELCADKLLPYLKGEIIPVKQDESNATYCYKEDISKEKAEIKFSTEPKEAIRMTKAFYDWPIAWFKFKDMNIKVVKTSVENIEHKFTELTLFRHAKSLYLSLENGAIKLEELQVPGKRIMSGQEYLYLASEVM